MKKEHVRSLVLKTFAYRDAFSYPLTVFQCYTYLISSKPVAFSSFCDSLESLKKEGLLELSGRYLKLSSLKKHRRDAAQEASSHLLKRAEKVAGFLGMVPWVRMVAVTGAVAAGNSFENDDIDVLVVAAPKRLWLTRGLVAAALKLSHLYRTDSDERGKICPNIFMSEDSLKWKSENLVIAHDILLMKPVFDRGNCYLKFLSANDWVRGFLPHIEFERVAHKLDGQENLVLDYLEKLGMRLQLWYMKARKTKEITTEELIHFNRDDHSKEILSGFERRCKELGV